MTAMPRRPDMLGGTFHGADRQASYVPFWDVSSISTGRSAEAGAFRLVSAFGTSTDATATSRALCRQQYGEHGSAGRPACRRKDAASAHRSRQPRQSPSSSRTRSPLPDSHGTVSGSWSASVTTSMNRNTLEPLPPVMSRTTSSMEAMRSVLRVTREHAEAGEAPAGDVGLGTVSRVVGDELAPER